MASIIDYIKTLVGRMDKSTIQKDIEAVLKEMEQYTIPQAQAAAVYAQINPFESNTYDVFKSHLFGILRIRGEQNPFRALADSLLIAKVNADYLKKVIDAELQTDTIREGMSARAGILVRCTEGMSFISEFSMKLIDYVMQREIEYVTGEQDDDLAPATVQYVENNLDRFFRQLFDMSVDPKEFEAMIESVPAVVVNEGNLSKVGTQYGKASLDPFKNGEVMNGFVGNPIYHVRMMNVAYEAKRLQNAKDRKKALELRLIHLKNMKNQSPNPAIERELEGIQKRIDEYEVFIRGQMDLVK